VGRHEFLTPDAASAVLAPTLVALGIGLLWAASSLDRKDEPPLRIAILLGELTYPLYLTHATLGVLILRALPPRISPVGRVILTTLLALAVAMLFAKLEAPLRRYLTRKRRPASVGRQVADFVGAS
jgi:peptidoglycan/LPS O-acetylase OafA/YrhL